MTTEEELRRFNRTTYYQTIVYQKIQDTIIDRNYRPTKACQHLGEKWADVRRFLSTEQKEVIERLNRKYGQNTRSFRRISTRPKSLC